MAGKKTSFEDALSEMEQIVERMEQDDLTLSDALSDFERGVVLMRICESHLKTAEGKLTELTKGENGKFIERALSGMTSDFETHDTEDEKDE
jgi:exodeoxyribonuclease VII small subunit